MSDFRNDDKYQLAVRLLDSWSEKEGIERVEYGTHGKQGNGGGYVTIRFREKVEAAA